MHKAAAFMSPSILPEELIAIWEMNLLDYLKLGYDVLIVPVAGREGMPTK